MFLIEPNLPFEVSITEVSITEVGRVTCERLRDTHARACEEIVSPKWIQPEHL